MDLLNDRGIFIVNIMRSILMKLSYQDKYKVVDRNMSDSNVGGRKNKNIRNHIFVLNSVMNDVIQNKKKCIDVEILDYKQCFDSMWMDECINDLWDAGVQDDHLALIYEINSKVDVAVKTPFGLTERKQIEKVVMQGEVYGPLCCSVQVDTFGKECMEKNKFLYQYKESVGIPPLSMVDDLVLTSRCGIESVLMNGFINCKTNQKKLQYGVDKCHRMHVGPKNHLCPDLFIDSWEVKSVDVLDTGVTGLVDSFTGSSLVESSDSEKYLGDIICKDGSNKKNIEARKGKGTGIKNQIMDILDDICFGPYTFEVALVLRDSLLINGILTNSEAWLALSTAEVEQLEQADESLMRRILKVSQGCPKEMLYLELGCTPIRFIIMLRRIMFLHYMLHEDPNCLIQRVLQAQIAQPSKNYFVQTVENILEELDIHFSYDDLKKISKQCLNKFVKQKIDEKAFLFLNQKKQKHSKVLHINHKALEMQNYLKPENVNSIQMSKFVFSARTRMLDLGANFPKKYEGKTKCRLGCDQLDSQEHLLDCPHLIENEIIVASNEVVYEDLFSSEVHKQLKIAAILESKFRLRKQKVQ